MEETKSEPREESVLIEQRKKIAMTGVSAVDAFAPRRIDLTLEGGGRAQITGDGLKIVSFSKASGNFSAVGKIEGVRFFGGHEKLAKRLFG